MGMTVARMMMVVVDMPSSSELVSCLLEPPWAVRDEEATGMLLMEPLFRRSLRLFSLLRAEKEPDKLKEEMDMSTTTGSLAMESITMVLTLTPAASAIFRRKLWKLFSNSGRLTCRTTETW